jgi:hypothetical protein
MKKPLSTQLTITLDQATAARVLLRASQRGLSPASFVGELVSRQLGKPNEYEAAYQTWRAEKLMKLRGAAPKRGDARRRGRIRGPASTAR